MDLDSIPTAAIEPVEILKDGASAVYGSDAIGGVVNIVTRRTWSGVEAQAYSGASSRGDGQNLRCLDDRGARERHRPHPRIRRLHPTGAA